MDTKYTIMNKQELFAEMAKCKMIMKSAEETYKDLEKVALELYGVESYKTEEGNWFPQERENWEVSDKEKLIKEITQREYIKHSTITKSGVVKIVGDVGFKKLEEKGIVALKSVSRFFMFKR